MCVSCGCGRFEESHDDERNLTVSSFQQAADAAKMTLPEVLKATIEGCTKMLSDGAPQHVSTGQAVKERLRPD